MAGKDAVVSELINEGRVDANATDKDGLTPFIHAAKAGHARVIQVFLDTRSAHADSTPAQGLSRPRSPTEHIRHTRDKGRTALSFAAEKGHSSVVKLLLKTGKVNPESRENTMMWTPLFYAAYNGHVSVANLLLESGADPDPRDESERTPLAATVLRDQTTMAKFLLDTGKVDPNTVGINGDTPISIAIDEGKLEMVRLLEQSIKAQSTRNQGPSEME